MTSISGSIGFTAGGIDASAIVESLMQVERLPLTAIQNRQTAALIQVNAVGLLRGRLDAIKASAAAMLTSGVGKMASSSTSSSVTAAITGSARQGSLTFTVDRLAQGSGVRTASTVASSTAVVTTAASLAVSSTAAGLGVGSIQVGVGVTNGAYTVSVTKATTGATIPGGATLGDPTVVDGSNNTLTLTVDGAPLSVTIANNTYSATGLAAAVQSAIDSAGGGATARVGTSGRLEIATTHEGSTASLAVTGGTSLAILHLTAGPAVTGTDGEIKIGSNPPVAVTSAGPGMSVVASTGTGNLTMQLTGGLRAGDAKVAVVSTGDRSLASVATAINSANVGVSAAAVQTSPGAWLLQVNSLRTGTANAVSLDSSVFAASGGLLQTAAAQDAKITIGTGPGAYSVVASTNSFSEVMPGVNITASALSATPVTVNVARDDTATADAVAKLIEQANALLVEITAQTKYDPATRIVAPLSSNSIVRKLAEDTRAAVSALVGGNTVGSASKIGISTLRDGSIKFDKAVFLSAIAADPDGIEGMFAQHGSSATGATWAASSAATEAGSYTFEVTTAPTRATTGVVLIGGSPAGQVIGVRVGATTVNYSAAAGESASDIALGLNAQLASAGLKIVAENTGGGVKLTAAGYGGSQSFESNLDVNGAGSWGTNTGIDVVGKLNGEVAIGLGNRLKLLSLGTSPARGLEIDIDEGFTTGALPLPLVDYQPGIAARLVTLATRLTSATGALTTSAFNYDAKAKGFNEQIDKFEIRMTTREANYRRQWSAIQTVLSSLENQGNWLTSQIGGMTNLNES